MADVRRIAGVILGAAAWWLVSCREIPAPDGGVFSISPIRLPLPGLVAGDTMRDSLGLVAPLRVIAYAADGEPLSPEPEMTFVALDTAAHFAGALLIGDNVGSVRVVGSVGSLQSAVATVKVTLAPDTLVPADSVAFAKSYSIPADTIAISPELGVVVQHLGTATSGVEAVVVRYTIDQAPTGNGQGATVVLHSGNARSDRDTTDATGRAARTARLRINALTTFASDTVLISATSSYRGVTLGTVQFTVIYTKQ
jgi:hypothetical protein